jgi:hypothetical protein
VPRHDGLGSFPLDESPVRNLLSKQQNNPVAKIWKVPDQQNELAPTGSAEYPYVITTYRLTERHLSGVMSRYLPMLAELHFIEEPRPTGDLAWLLMSDVCKHCAEAGCLDACPTGAIYRTEYGTATSTRTCATAAACCSSKTSGCRSGS